MVPICVISAFFFPHCRYSPSTRRAVFLSQSLGGRSNRREAFDIAVRVSGRFGLSSLSQRRLGFPASHAAVSYGSPRRELLSFFPEHSALCFPPSKPFKFLCELAVSLHRLQHTSSSNVLRSGPYSAPCRVAFGVQRHQFSPSSDN